MVASVHALNDLVAVLKDGIMLYQQVIDADLNPELKPVLVEMFAMREEVIARIAPIIESENAIVRPTGTFLGEMQRGFATVRAMLQDEQTAYLAELVALEERTVVELEDIMASNIDAEAKVILGQFLDRFRKNVQALKSLSAAT